MKSYLILAVLLLSCQLSFAQNTTPINIGITEIELPSGWTSTPGNFEGILYYGEADQDAQYRDHAVILQSKLNNESLQIAVTKAIDNYVTTDAAISNWEVITDKKVGDKYAMDFAILSEGGKIHAKSISKLIKGEVVTVVFFASDKHLAKLDSTIQQCFDSQ